MKFYQSKIFKIIMGLIAIIIIFNYSFLIFSAGIGLVVYLNKKNVKFRSFHKIGKIILSSFMILFTLFAIGIKMLQQLINQLPQIQRLRLAQNRQNLLRNLKLKEILSLRLQKKLNLR